MENWKGIVGTNCSACTAINTQIVINLWMKKAEFIFNHGYCILGAYVTASPASHTDIFIAYFFHVKSDNQCSIYNENEKLY